MGTFMGIFFITYEIQTANFMRDHGNFIVIALKLNVCRLYFQEMKRMLCGSIVSRFLHSDAKQGGNLKLTILS